jgi:hypothetical protein
LLCPAGLFAPGAAPPFIAVAVLINVAVGFGIDVIGLGINIIGTYASFGFITTSKSLSSLPLPSSLSSSFTAAAGLLLLIIREIL